AKSFTNHGRLRSVLRTSGDHKRDHTGRLLHSLPTKQGHPVTRPRDRPNVMLPQIKMAAPNGTAISLACHVRKYRTRLYFLRFSAGTVIGSSGAMISARRSSNQGGSCRFWPSSSSGSSVAKPMSEVANSVRMPPGERTYTEWK